MAVFSFRLGLLMVIICGVVFTSWTLDALISEQETLESSSSSISSNMPSEKSLKTKTVIGVQKLENRLLANRKHANEMTLANMIHEDTSDSAFPFDEESIDEENEKEDGDEIRSDRESGKANDAALPEIKTFYTAVKTTFKDVPILPDKSLPTLKFLDACIDALQVLTNMRKRIFDGVVGDIQGNIQQIRHNYDARPNESYTLQSLVLYDVEQLRILNEDPDYYAASTLNALKWVVRAFRFISRFATHISEGQEQGPSARLAYDETLTKHHGFVVRACFKAAFLTLSTRQDFLKEIAVNKADLDRPDFEKTAIADSRDYFFALEERLKLIEEFYTRHHIEP
eukprot:XP_011681380.1 PREDICTED: glycolipid transfer protein isoform X1 [Strongylocentrotus purpuratus]